MTIYLVNIEGTIESAHTSDKMAKEALWKSYCQHVDAETREKYIDEDRLTLKQGYIEEYGWVEVVELYDEEGR